MTVDQQLELHSQLGKALNYVRQGIKILCLEDNDRMQKLTYTEDDVLSWQQRYFELQEENKSLHKLLVSKDDVLNLALHSSGSNKMLYNQVRENEITMRKHIGLLNQVMEESNKTCSDLFISSAQYARTITNLESEVSHWRLIATEQQCELTKSKEMLTLLSWNLCHLPQSFEVEPPNSEHFNAFNETALDAMGQLIHESQRIKKELHYAQSKYAALFEQNHVLQKEYEKQSQHIFDMNIIQEKMEKALQTHQNVLQSLLRGLSSTQLHLKNTQAEYASLKSTNEELCNELEIQKYRNDALDEVSRELASKVQSGTIVDLQKFQQLQQEKTDLQSVLADTESKRDSAIQRLLESDARLQKMEAKCQALQESLDNDDQIRLKYRNLFKELEESLSSNKKLKDVNDMLENSVKTLTTELETAIKQCSVSQTALEDLIKEHASFQEQANSESKVNGERINDLQLSLEKQLSLENELRSQLRNEIERVAEMQAFKTSLADDLHSTNAALSILQSQYDDIKVNFDRINHENECLAAQVESAEVAKSVALDMVASTKSQLMEAESREHVLNDAIESLNLTIAKMTENAALTSDEKLALASDLDLRNEEYVSLKKELEEVSEYMATLKQQVDSFKESLTRASLQHVEDAEQIENLQSELKNSKARLEKLQDVNKMLQQDLPSSQTDDSVILREKSKTKALSKQVATLKKKSKDLEKDCQRWKALYEKELVGKALT